MEKQKTAEKSYLFLCRRAVEIMVERIEKELPKKGTFGNISVSFTIPETVKKASLIVEDDALNGDLRRVSAAIRLRGGDDMIQTYFFRGTNEEIITFLQRKAAISELKDVWDALSLRADE